MGYYDETPGRRECAGSPAYLTSMDVTIDTISTAAGTEEARQPCCIGT